MRKRNKKKRTSCAMCKPHKMGWANRWKPAEEEALRRFEQEMRTEAKDLDHESATLISKRSWDLI